MAKRLTPKDPYESIRDRNNDRVRNLDDRTTGYHTQLQRAAATENIARIGPAASGGRVVNSSEKRKPKKTVGSSVRKSTR